MISVSSIKQHMYCPMKLYIQTHRDKSEIKNYQLAFEIKRLKIDINDTLEKNMHQIKKEMSILEIEESLKEGIDLLIENSTKIMRSMKLDLSQSDVGNIISNTDFKIKIMALKLKQSMMTFNRDAYSLTSMFFPNSLYNLYMKDEQLGLMGNCDKTEIIDGMYYPVLIKNSKPPMKGVWDSDAIELVAYAILLEYEFDSDIYVGFVDYEKTSDRRVVVMDHNLRRGLFDVISEVKEIIEDKKVPNVTKSISKCNYCEYKDICST